jgi:hypothetical protein
MTRGDLKRALVWGAWVRRGVAVRVFAVMARTGDARTRTSGGILFRVVQPSGSRWIHRIRSPASNLLAPRVGDAQTAVRVAIAREARRAQN